MKPRFDFKHGVWRCRLWLDRWIAGFGGTVQEAWADYQEDWKRLTR